MAYVTGSAADMAAVKTALVNACTANGWTEQTDAGGKTMLSNSGCYVRVEATSTALQLLGRTSLDSGDSPTVVQMKQVLSTSIAFPVTYFAFVFATEVFFVINYSDMYQWIAFGQSQQPGLPGTGNWISATCFNAANDDANISIREDGGGQYYDNTVCPALFWASTSEYGNPNCWIHNNFETAYPWSIYQGGNKGNDSGVGIGSITEFIKAQPNQFNGEGILLPIRAYKRRPESKLSQILEIENARHIRIDNYTPEQVITLGSDEWMVFPWFRKNATERDAGQSIDHTGTFGWAIKKA